MYKAFVAKIDCIEEIPGAEKIQVGIVLGTRVIISKDWAVGDVGLFFPVDVQLSEEFCNYNNLFRDSTKNRNKEISGFFEDSRRVRAQPFMKVKSEGFFCGLDALAYCGENHYIDLVLGDSFDELSGFKICNRYESEKAKAAKVRSENNKQKQKKVSEAPTFHKHCDTNQFKMFAHHIKKGSLISVHAKVHGTSARYGYLPVTRTRTFNKFITALRSFFSMTKEVKTTQYEYIVGTRNVTMLEDQRQTKEGFHGKEEYRFEVLDTLKPYLDKGMTIYGEIAGFVNGKRVMPTHSTKVLNNKKFVKKYGEEVSYTYGCNETQYRFHVYRITYQTEDGVEIDFTPAQLEQWCEDRGIIPHLNVCEPFIYDGDLEALVAKVEALTEREELLTEDFIDPSHVSEGVIVRVDCGNMRPIFYKSKSYAFKVMEGIQKETSDEVDIEELS